MIQADSLKTLAGIRHGFFTREGGVSTGLYSSLNCGFGSQDRNENVAENRKRVAAQLGADPHLLLTSYQTHGSNSVTAQVPWQREIAPEADSIVARGNGIAVAVLTADCAPVLFADPETRIVAAAHAGWRGALRGILEETLDQMEAEGASRQHVYAVIGPALSLDSYEVSFEFRDNFLKEGPENACFFRQYDSERPYFDLPGYCAKRLAKAGVTHIEDLSLCTYTNESLFFSYRRATHRNEPDYGRQISAILAE